MSATNRDVVGDKCKKNDRGILATSDKERALPETAKWGIWVALRLNRVWTSLCNYLVKEICHPLYT